MRKTICLGDMATYINGYAFKPVDWGTKGLPIIRIQNLTDSGKDYNYYDGEIKEKYLVKKGDVLISWSASIGVFEWEKEDAWLNQHIFKVVFDKKEVNKQYFKYVTSYVLKKSLQYAHGSTMKHLTKSTFDKLPIPIYDLKVQRVIAEKIGKVDEAIAECDAMLADFDLLVKSRFVEMFGDINLNEKTWATSRMEDICESIGDGLHGTPKYDEQGKIPFINGNNLDGTIIHTSTTKYIDEEEYKRLFIHLSNNAILLSINGTLGKLAYYCGEKVCLGKSAAYFNVKHDYNRIFVYELMRTEQFQQYLESNSTKSTIKNVGLKALRDYKIITPPHDLQNQFADFVQQVDKSKLIIQKSMDNLMELRNSLLQEYFG